MGLHWWWYAETLGDDGWKFWPRRTDADRWGPRPLLFVPGRRRVMDLFVGPRPLIALSADLPTRPPESEYLDSAERHHGGQRGRRYWCEFDACWSTSGRAPRSW